MGKLLDRRTSDKEISYLNRANLSEEVGDAYKIFCDQTARFLHQHDEKFFKIFKASIRCEVKAIAENEKKAELNKNAIDNKCIDKGDNDPATKESITMQKSDSTSQESKLEEVETSKPEVVEESKKQEENPEVEEYANVQLGKFDDNFTQNNTDLFKFMTEIVKQHIHTKGKTVGKKAYSSAQPFCEKLVKNLDNDDMKAYLSTLVRNCSFWAKNKDFQKLPVIYPQRIRGSDKLKMDYRGFRIDSNPIRNITKVKVKEDDQKSKKSEERGRIIEGTFIYKGLRLDDGFEACHIWYDTTKAPPLFTFVPNVVWLPQIIGRLSDKVVENKFFPPLLKHLSNKYYQLDNVQEMLKPVVAGCQLGLKENGIEKSQKEEGIDSQYLLEKKNYGYYSYGDVKVNTKRRIKRALDYIEKCKKIAEKTVTKKEPSEEKLPEETKKSPMEELIKQYEEEQTSSRIKALHKGKETKRFREWLRFGKYYEETDRYSEKETDKFRKWVEQKRKQKKPGKKAQRSYNEELKKIIIESKESNYDAIYDLETWLAYYYNAIIKIKNKEPFLKALKDGEDLVKNFKLTEEEINKNIEEIFGSGGPKDIKGAQNYLLDKNVSNVLEALDKINDKKQKTVPEEIPKEETQAEQKLEQVSKEEKPTQEKPQEMFDLKMFVKALSNREGTATKDLEKKKVGS